MKGTAALLIATLGLLLPAIQTQAHHSFAAEFDDTTGELTGVITSARYTNPHPRYQILVTLEDGTTEDWELQGASVTNLRSSGWDREFLQVGDEVTVRGSLGRNGAQKLFLRGLTKSSGETWPAQTARGPGRDEIQATEGYDYGYGIVNEDAPFDITGPWRNAYRFRVTVDDLEPKPVPFTAEARAIYEDTVHYDDYSLRCVAPGLPRIFGAPYDMEIIDAGSHYVFIYIEHNTPRWVYMDGRSAPENFPNTSMGYSVGHWEGEELVIETSKLTPGWLDGSGLPYHGGDDTRIVERYAFADDMLSIERVMTIFDSYYTQPLTRVRGSARQDGLVITEHDSCDPTSYYQDLLEAGELEERLAED